MTRAIDAFAGVIGQRAIDQLEQLARPLAGARVLHVNSTRAGGGVAEILSALVPLMNDVGLTADWQVIRGSDEFYGVTKAMHNSLQGMYMDWTPQMRDIWLHVDDAQFVFDGRKTDAAERDDRGSITRREILVNQPCASLIELNQHGSRTPLPRQRHFDGALLLQREAVLLARVALDVTGSCIVRERTDSGVNHLLGRHKTGRNVGTDCVSRRGRGGGR